MKGGLERICLIMTLFEMVESVCNFPRKWHGRWFDSGSIEVVITAAQFSNKGECFDRHRDYYLVENRLEHCHQCLLITDRHANVIQYKQSYCIGRVSLQSICAQIRVGSMFFTLVREVSVPVSCPFQKSFHFVYNNNSLCYCRSPMSYLQHCSDETRMNFNFRKCRNCALTFDQEVEFECLATWRDGQDHFAVGAFLRLDHVSTTTYTYHCFQYHMYDSVMYIIMSADISCHGFLRSPKHDQLTIELTEDTWPSLGCAFPVWMSSITWRDLYSNWEYSFTSASDVMIRHRRRILSHRANATTRESLGLSRATFKCLKIHSEQMSSGSKDDAQLFSLVQVLEGCQSRYRCVRFRHRQLDLLQVQLGNYVQDVETNCSVDAFKHPHTSHLLVNSELVSGPCPFTGRYLSDLDHRGCQMELRSGCDDHSHVVLASTCHDEPMLQLECLKWWSVRHKLFLLTRQHQPVKHEDIILYQCYSFHPVEDRMEFSHEEWCDYEAHGSISSSNGHHSHHSNVISQNNQTKFIFLYTLAPCAAEETLAPSTTMTTEAEVPAQDADSAAESSADNQLKIIREINQDKELQDDDGASPRQNHFFAIAISSSSFRVFQLNLVSISLIRLAHFHFDYAT